MLLDHNTAFRGDTSSFNPASKSSASPSFSPSFSSGSSESYALSRCSSISSLASVYSAASSTSATSTDDEFSHQTCLISILKKPRRFHHGRKRNQSHNDGNNHHNDNDVEQYEENENGDGEAEELGEWEDEESECDIVFERNVTFDEPLATDIITGKPVSSSSLSRLEWTALRARECLERERAVVEGAWSGFEEDDAEADAEADTVSESANLAGKLPKWRDTRNSETGKEGQDKDGSIVGSMSEIGIADDRRDTRKSSEEEGKREGEKGCDAEAGNSALGMTKPVTHLVGQRQLLQLQQ